MHRLRVNQVHHHQKGRDSELRDDHHRSGQPRRLKHSHADQQMHAFVFCFFQQRSDPSLVSVEPAQGAEMTTSSGYKAWNACDRLQHNQPPFHRLNRCVAFFVARHIVEGSVQADHLKRILKRNGFQSALRGKI